jgi:hypothetical protein
MSIEPAYKQCRYLLVLLASHVCAARALADNNNGTNAETAPLGGPLALFNDGTDSDYNMSGPHDEDSFVNPTGTHPPIPVEPPLMHTPLHPPGDESDIDPALRSHFSGPPIALALPLGIHNPSGSLLVLTMPLVSHTAPAHSTFQPPPQSTAAPASLLPLGFTLPPGFVFPPHEEIDNHRPGVAKKTTKKSTKRAKKKKSTTSKAKAAAAAEAAEGKANAMKKVTQKTATVTLPNLPPVKTSTPVRASSTTQDDGECGRRVRKAAASKEVMLLAEKRHALEALS